MPIGLDSLRLSLRSLLSTRVTSLAVIVTLALGTGANTAVLAVVYGVLVRPLPFEAPDRLVVIDTVAAKTNARVGIRLDEVEDWRRRVSSVDGLAAFSVADLTLRGADTPENLHCLLVTGSFFRVLGASAERGQPFADSRASTIVLRHTLSGRLGGGSEVVGRSVTLGAAAFQVGAVMPAAFTFPTDDVEAWVPAESIAKLQVFGTSDQRPYRLVGRLRPGVTLTQLRQEVVRTQHEVHPDQPGVLATAVRLLDLTTADTRPVLVAFVAAAGLLLLVACANAAVLLVGRAAARRRELAVRLALGASPTRLVCSAFLESAILAVVGSALGLLLAQGALRLLLRAAGASLPRQDAIAIGWPVFAAVVILAGLVTVLSGLAPALGAARTDFAAAFRATAASSSANPTRAPLVVLQVAVAVLLLTSAGLFGRTVLGLLREHGGVEPDHVVTARLMLAEGTQFDAAGRKPFVETLLQRVGALPGVVAAGVGSSLPPNHNQISMTIRMVDDQGRGDPHAVDFVAVTPGYLRALGIRLEQGRLFDDHDAQTGLPIAILGAKAGRDLSANRNPVDRDFIAPLPTVSGERVRPRVVGVVSDVHYTGLDAVANDNVYVLWQNLPTAYSYLVARTAGDPTALMSSIRIVVHDLDPGLPLPTLRTLDDEMNLAIAGRELRLELVAAFAILALLVAVLGLSAALARSVVERRAELAIRSALGATPRSVISLIATGGLRLVGVGVALGSVATAGCGRWLASLLAGVSPYDPATYAAVGLVVLVTAATACYLPARRAARVDPLQLLRGE
jgi:putative ABC transport system permease protein